MYRKVETVMNTMSHGFKSPHCNGITNKISNFPKSSNDIPHEKLVFSEIISEARMNQSLMDSFL